LLSKQLLNWSQLCVLIAFARANRSVAGGTMIGSVLPLLSLHVIAHLARMSCCFDPTMPGAV
jgi:hypothetical protein